VREAGNGVWKNPFLPPTPTSRIHVFKKDYQKIVRKSLRKLYKEGCCGSEERIKHEFHTSIFLEGML